VIIYVNPIYNINRFELQECVGFTWRVSDCEELVGVTHTEEVKVSPVLTTATKVLFPNTISVRVFEVGKVLLGRSAF